MLEEELRAQIQSLAQTSLDQEEQLKYLTTRLQDSQESEVKERLMKMRVERHLTQKTDEYEQVCLELEGLRENFLIQRRLYTELRAEKMYWEEQYTKIAQAGRDNHKIIPHLYQEYRYYKDKHEKLAFLANNLIEDIPRSLKDAESVMAPLLEDGDNFLKLCRIMVDRFREDIRKRA